jgi:hypothetical protein
LIKRGCIWTTSKGGRNREFCHDIGKRSTEVFRNYWIQLWQLLSGNYTGQLTSTYIQEALTYLAARGDVPSVPAVKLISAKRELGANISMKDDLNGSGLTSATRF